MKVKREKITQEEALNMLPKQDDTILHKLNKEKEDLEEKVNKLDTFIESDPVFSALSKVQRILLVDQFNAMKLYLYALTERIWDLSPKGSN